MAFDALALKNQAVSKLATAVNDTDDPVTLTVTAGDGDLKFPATSGGKHFKISLINAISNEYEIVRATSRSGDSITATRAQEGTTRRAFSLNDVVEVRLTAGDIDDLIARISQASTTARGTVALATDAQAKAGNDTTRAVAPAALAAVIDETTPAGQVIRCAGAGTPPGRWRECNGQNVSRTTYAALFTAIGTAWGAGNGSTTFSLPDLRRRVPVGKGGTGTTLLGSAVGNLGGTERVLHTHGVSGTTGGPSPTVLARNLPGPAAASSTHTHSFSVTSGGASNTANLQPSAVFGYWIKA